MREKKSVGTIQMIGPESQIKKKRSKKEKRKKEEERNILIIQAALFRYTPRLVEGAVASGFIADGS